MTYKHVVFRPGPRINLVIGPNGVGKSSILCAVVLGLGGKPNLLGRQKHLKEFVRRGADDSTGNDKTIIRITLKANPDDAGMDQDPEIERSFTRSGNTSNWKINGKSTTEKVVTSLVRDTYGIKLDNLCMFLPQDIVQKFTEYNHQELLRETQVAILGVESVEEQDRLQKLVDEDKHRDHKRKLLEQEKDKHSRRKDQLEQEVRAYLEFRKKKAELDKRKGKLYFLEFRDLQDKGKILQKEKKEAKKEFQAMAATYDPLQKEVDQAKVDVNKTNKILKKDQTKLSSSEEKLKSHRRSLQKAQAKHGRLNEEIGEMNYEIKKTIAKMEKAQNLRPECVAKVEEFPEESVLKEKKNEIKAQFRPELSRINAEIKKVQAKQRQKEDDGQDNKSKRENIQSRLGVAQNVQKQKIAMLKQHASKGDKAASTAYRCAASLSKLKGRVKGKVLGPMMLLLTPKDSNISPDLAATIEQGIGKRWRYAFAFEDPRDYDMLKSNGDAQAWKDVTYAVVNDRAINESALEAQRPISTADVEGMKSQGLLGYVDQFINAPTMVMNLLYSKAQISSTMLGDSRALKTVTEAGDLLTSLVAAATDRQNGSRRQSSSSSSSSPAAGGRRLQGVLRIVTKTYNASLKVAEHGEAQNMTSFEDHRDNPSMMLTKNVDQALLKKLREEFKQIESEMETQDAQIAQIRAKLTPLINERATLMKEVDSLTKDLNQQIKERKNALNDVKKCDRKIAGCEETLEEQHRELSSAMNNIEKHRTTLWCVFIFSIQRCHGGVGRGGGGGGVF